MSTSGVGVVDTSSLWASASLIFDHDLPPDAKNFDRLSHPNRELHHTKYSYFLSLLHNLVLYDELRTDIDVLAREFEWYRTPVRELLRHLSTAVTIESIPQTVSDLQIIEQIAPAFVKKTKSELRSANPSAGTDQITAAAAEYAYARAARYSTPGASRGLLGDEYSGADASFEASEDDVHEHALSESVAKELFKLAKSDLGLNLNGLDDTSAKYRALVRNLTILARTVRYAAHSRFVHSSEKRPSAFCASPRRIELLQDYLDGNYLKSIQASATAFHDLFSQLGLPKSGYDFSGFTESVKPLSMTDLSQFISGLKPQEALDRVMDLRNKPEAKELRQIWAGRLWNNGEHALEGYGRPIAAAMTNVNAGGDVYQIIAVELSGTRRLPGRKRVHPANREPGAGSIKDLRRWFEAELGKK